MAGVESMIVEEKQPPTKQIDREKVNKCILIIFCVDCWENNRFFFY